MPYKNKIDTRSPCDCFHAVFPPPSCAAGAPAQISRSDNGGERRSSGFGEPDSPSWRGIIPVDSLGVFQTIFHLPRSLSIGYFSADGDSLPTSPLSPRPPTADRATQTPSLSGQAMQHALQRMAGLCGGEPGTTGLIRQMWDIQPM
uniref:Uncharacterized protein n=1 Tax=Mola mola TaxID=94237 RepID=A0A3Q4AXL5_MOLML